LARRLRVCRDDPDDVSRAAHDGHGEKRLELLLLELGDVLRPRIGKSVLADDRGLAVLGGPPGEALPALERDLADLPLVRRRRRAQDETGSVVLDEGSDARVAGASLRTY